MKSSTSPPSAPSEGQPGIYLRAFLALCLLALAVVFVQTAALAQAPATSPRSSPTASPLTGRVLDPTGAIIPGAKVELKRPD